MGAFAITAILICTLIFNSYDAAVTGELTLSPSEIAPVCHVGDRLELTCSTTMASLLRWRISVTDEQLQSRALERNINSDDVGAQTSNITVNSTSFDFRRTSTQRASLLVSTLTITNATTNLNGTRVHCVEVDGSMSANYTTIIIVDTDDANSSVNMRPEHYGIRDVTVTVSLKLPQRYASYNVSITPCNPLLPINFTFDGITHVIQVTLLYNVEYNLNVEVKVLCRANNMITSFYLHYANCGKPLPSTNSVLKITGYNGPPALEGTTVNFHCSSGLVLIGNASAACMTQGQWEPDPNELTCTVAGDICESPLPESLSSIQRVMAYTLSDVDPTLQTVVHFSCPNGLTLTGPSVATCVNDSHWVPDPTDVKCINISGLCNSCNSGSMTNMNGETTAVAVSLVVVLIVSSICMFITGFVTRHCFTMRMKEQSREKLEEMKQVAELGDPSCMYEEIQADRQPELKQNVAYGPIL